MGKVGIFINREKQKVLSIIKNMSYLPEIIKKIWSKFSHREKIILLILFLIPLVLSFLTFIIKNFIPTIFPFLPIKNHIIYFIFWVFSLLFIALSILMSFPYINKFIDKEYQTNHNSLWELFIWLTKKRNITRIELFQNISVSIISFYIQIFLLTYIIHNNILSIMPITFFFLLLFGFISCIYCFLNIIVGFQDGRSKKIVVSLISLPYLIYFFLYIYSKTNLKNPINIDTIIPAMDTLWNQIISILVIPIVIYFLLKFFDKASIGKKSIFYREQKLEAKGWNKFFISRGNVIINSFPIFIISYSYGALMVYAMLDKFDANISLNEFLEYCIIFAFIGGYFGYLFLRPFLQSLIKKINDWHELYQIYNGQFRHDSNDINQLIKISGKCVSLTNSDRYRNIIPDFDQQFKIAIDGDNTKLLEVIRSKERSPFNESLKIIRENDQIIVYGKIKDVYDESQDSYKILIAYHVKLAST